MKVKDSSSVFTFECYATAQCVFESQALAMSTVYMHSSMQHLSIISSIDSIDATSRDRIASNVEFSSFIGRSIELIQCSKKYHHIKLEKLEDNDFSYEKFRLTFHLQGDYSSSIFDAFSGNKRKKEIYEKINKILFKESKDLRKQIVIDERVL